jgi:hypothetical protein
MEQAERVDKKLHTKVHREQRTMEKIFVKMKKEKKKFSFESVLARFMLFIVNLLLLSLMMLK